MNIKWALAGLALAVPGLPAAAMADTPAPKVKSANSKRICRVEDEIGTRFKRRICGTKQEWDQKDALATEARKDIDKLQQQRSIVDH